MRHVRIAWLWGAPRAVSLVRGMKPLLGAQGVSIALSHPSSPVEADSVVIPPASDPEHRLVDDRLYRASLIVEDNDEQRALYRALCSSLSSTIKLALYKRSSTSLCSGSDAGGITTLSASTGDDGWERAILTPWAPSKGFIPLTRDTALGAPQSHAILTCLMTGRLPAPNHT